MVAGRINQYGFGASQMLCVGHHLADVSRIRFSVNLVLRIEHGEGLVAGTSNNEISYELNPMIEWQMNLRLTAERSYQIALEPGGDESLEQPRHLNNESSKLGLTSHMGRASAGENEMAEPVQPFIVR